ncbi:crotonobetainyl-CoA:carnitine CoA-transferase CaiB-like acyl-CoA transferase [Mycobacterium frederiksbergense]|uniref:Crotonobetainyl-CoA:carnitine CoA-transferase CaiB-like acyl-CoA transferase n=1 Tax=Mycolicibacterium frederiksbergense TaxID=117567 RepID=A0ABT6L571_9MYCO|nr:CoA transferase [Mycolicibacterium frederiksbergense]MDH6198103.1 crotonobetainyl-CoA:carnitine CoA-transferase CaiB-like acyl-CoA transferase [Mycolicibacterium frederiksbergense]
MTTPTLRVVDLTDPLGHQAARLFVGLGADVVRLAVNGETSTTAGALHWHAGKRVLTVDDLDQLDSTVAGLVNRADVVLESGPRAALRTLALRESDPDAWAHVAHVVVTPFGLTGPRRDWLADDTVLTAAGGMAWLGGDPGHAPEPPPREQGIQLAGTHAAIGALLALHARRRTGVGQLVEISAQEAVAATLETGAIAWIHGRSVPGRTSGVYGHVAHRVFRAADGYLAGGYSGSPRMWDDLLAWMAEEGEAEDLTDTQWQDNDVRWAGRAHVDEVVGRFVARRSARPFAEEARRRALPWAEVATGPALLENPQLLARRFFVDIDGPESVRDVGLGWESPGMPRPVRLAPPRPTTAAGAWPDPPSPTDRALRPRARTQRGAALDGVRVLDLTWVLAGPYVTKTLGEHGAEIIKVESQHRKDPTRFSPSMRLRPNAGIDDSGYFLNFNRNKRSLALNLRTESGQDLLRRLVPVVDVVVENFSPGVLAKWGLDYPNLRELNPDIVLVSMAGVGQTGPWRTAVTFADTLAAMSGLTAETARVDRAPQGLTFGLGDMVAANAAVLGTLELLNRAQGGHVDLSQLEAMASHLGTALLESQLPAGPAPTASPRIIRTRGEDRWLAVGAVPATVLRAALDDLAVEAAGPDPLDDLERHAVTCDAEDLAAQLQARGVPAHPVRDGRDLVEHDPQLSARHFYPVLEHPLAGPVRHEGIVARLSGTPGGLWEPAPLLGQHTDLLITELLGLTSAELSDLRAQGVLS